MTKKKARKKFTAATVGEKAIMAITEDDNDALDAVMHMMRNYGPKPTIALLSQIADMNIRGVQFAYAYQVIFENNTAAFVAAIETRDPKLVEQINELYKGETPYKAVTEGALTAEKIPTFD